MRTISRDVEFVRRELRKVEIVLCEGPGCKQEALSPEHYLRQADNWSCMENYATTMNWVRYGVMESIRPGEALVDAVHMFCSERCLFDFLEHTLALGRPPEET